MFKIIFNEDALPLYKVTFTNVLRIKTYQHTMKSIKDIAKVLLYGQKDKKKDLKLVKSKKF